MLFSSSTFVFVFLPVVLFAYYMIPSKYISARNTMLFVFSLCFYAYGEPIFVLVMMASIICNYIFGILISKGKSKRVFLSIGISIDILLIFIFKYLNFVIYNINSFFELLSLQNSLVQTEIVLPIGISFFTFQSISYLIDVYREVTPVQKNPMYLGLYISFFPQLIAGPIVRYTEINRAINDRTVTFESFSNGTKRFVFGLTKKVLISNSMALMSDGIFGIVGAGNDISVLTAWLGAIAYTLQIYFDFSGYSDMAIGLGKMFGFNFSENFNYPYISKSISEFWRRWHISLGTWFRDYVYFPMGGSRVTSRITLVRNLLVVWVLTGVWHGANWTFIAWGLMYFFLISFEKITRIPERLNTRGRIFYQVFTMCCVVMGWVLFRADNIAIAIDYINSMFGIGSNLVIDNYFIEYVNENIVLLSVAIVASTPVIKHIIECLKTRSQLIGHSVELILGMALFIIIIAQLVLQSYNPFIYFNF